VHSPRSFIAEKDKNRVTTAIGQVNGRPALVITPDTNAYTHSNPAVVIFNRNSVHVGIYSNTYGTDTLLAIVESMHQPAFVAMINGHGPRPGSENGSILQC
jgi:hypothetical protein